MGVAIAALAHEGVSMGTKSVVASGQTGPAFHIAKFPVIVALIPANGASGKVQFSTSPIEDVMGGIATWQDWANGVVAAVTTDFAESPITGLRAISVSGQVTMEIAQ